MEFTVEAQYLSNARK